MKQMNQIMVHGIGKGKFDVDLPLQPIHYRDTLISLVLGAFPLLRIVVIYIVQHTILYIKDIQ